MEWLQYLIVLWFVDGLLIIDGIKSKWKIVVYSQGEEMVIIEEGFIKLV